MTLSFASRAMLALVIGSAVLVSAPPQSLADDAAQIDAMRKALEKYKDPYVAVKDLYLSTVACVYFDGTKEEGHIHYEKGAMGVHFVNLTVQGPLDPTRPNVLLYEPRDGKLNLVGAEWLVPLSVAKERPSLLGHEFLGPMEGHEPLIPAAFHHYDLHVWLFKDNPLGMFAATNPDVSCDEAQFKLLEKGTKIVPAQ